MIATADQTTVPGTGRPAVTGPQECCLVCENRVWNAKYEREVGDHSDHGGGDAGQGGREVLVAPQPLDVGRAEEDEQEGGHERHPGGEQRGDDGGHPRVQRSGVAVGAEERHELHDHDQRPGGASRPGPGRGPSRCR